MHPTPTFRPTRILAAALLLALLGIPPRPAAALTEKTVTLCNEDGLLREIASAPDNTTVFFDCGGPTTIVLSQTLEFARPLRLDGDGLITLTSAGAGRVVRVSTGAVAELVGLTIAGGATAGAGGGVLNEGALLLEDVAFVDNQADTGGALASSGVLDAQRVSFARNRAVGDGGALAGLPGARLTLAAAHMAGNSAGGRGGAIWASAALTLTEALLAGNSAADGGGLALEAAGSAELRDSELRDNSASGAGGGVWSAGALTVAGSTLAGNSAASAGGLDNSGALTLARSTVSGNHAAGDAGGIASGGTLVLSAATVAANQAGAAAGGVYVSDGGSVTARGALLAANSAPVGPDCLGLLTSQGGNLVQRTGSCALTPAPGDITGEDPLLQPLADNGGPSRTHALAPGSPAADAVDAGSCAALTDQRGVNRPMNGGCDIGAFELGFVVNSLADDEDANLVTPTCDVAGSPGVCTLRAAVQQANNLFGKQAITFVVEGVIALAPRDFTGEADGAGDLDITQDLIIVGQGAGRTVIDGGGDPALGGLLDIAFGASASVSGVTLRGGNAGAMQDGGAIRNAGSLVLYDSVVTGSSAPDRGGGIASTGALSLARVTVSGNHAGSGGGIASGGQLTAADSTVSGNTARSTLMGGGGIISQGPAALTNVTVSGNRAAHNGGGIVVGGGGPGALRLTNVTVTDNTANADVDTDIEQDDFGDGGGLFVRDGNDALLANTLLAGNIDRTSGGLARPDCAGKLVSLGHNLIGVNTLSGSTTSCISASGAGDLLGAAASPLVPLLGPLRDNGGPTLTHGLRTGSPAINAGSRAAPGMAGGACAGGDQRGAARPIGAACDIGASEAPLADLRVAQDLPPGAALVGRELAYTISVTNDGPSPTDGVELTAAIPSAMALQPNSLGRAACAESAGRVTCPLGRLESGETATVTLALAPGTPGVAAFSASVAGAEADPAPANNGGAAETLVEHGLFLPVVRR